MATFCSAVARVICHPGLDAKARIKIILRRLANRAHVARMEACLNRLGLDFILDSHPRMVEKPSRAYLADGLNKQQVSDFFCGHYTTLAQHFGRPAIAAIYTQRLPLLTGLLADSEGEIILHYDQSMEKEGELTLSLLIKGERIYSLGFLLAGETIYIGSLQGSKSSLDEIRRFTRKYHGLRPQNFLVFLIRALAQALACTHIKAISNAAHVYTGKKRTQSRVRFDYDSFWLETGGTLADPQFFDLPLQQPCKEAADIPMHKRAMYRRRYELFATCTSALASELSALAR